jgi:hypothetical protein
MTTLIRQFIDILEQVQHEVLAPEGLREALRVEAEAIAAMLGRQRKPLAPAAGVLNPWATARSR